MNTQGHYIVDFDPFAVRFPESFVVEGIRWYGLAYLAGFVIAYLLLNLYTSRGKSPLSKDDNSTFITYLLFGVIIGGRLGYMLFYDFAGFCENPLTVFYIWKGGMASHGGFIGVVAAIMAYCFARKVGFWTLSDIIVTICTPGFFSVGLQTL